MLGPNFLALIYICWTLIFSIYKSSWDKLKTKNQNLSFYQCIAVQFSKNNISSAPKSNIKKDKDQISKEAEVSRVLLLVSSRPSKSNLAKSKFYQNRISKLLDNQNNNNNNNNNKCLYDQTLLANIKEIVKIKDSFPQLSSKKIEKIHNTINKLKKKKPHINIITKGLSRKQVIIPMSNANSVKFLVSSGENITNINRELKNIKSDILAKFIQINQCGIIITTNKAAVPSDLRATERYIKNIKNIKQDNISTLQLF